MPHHNFEYPKNVRNTVIRKGKDRGKYDVTTINNIIHTSMVVHVSFKSNPEDIFPATLPMIAVMGSYARPSADLDEPLDCYLHGYISSRIMNLARPAAAAAGPPADPASTEHTGLPVTISAAKVDGLVLSLTPNSHSYNYRSALLFGHAHPVLDAAEKLYALELITDKILPGRWAGTRVPPNAAEMASTNVLRVEIVSGSAKIRAGPPADAKSDLEDEGVLDRVWTGFVPVVETMGMPVESTYNRVGEVPAYVEEAREGFNAVGEEYVQGVLREVQGRNVAE